MEERNFAAFVAWEIMCHNLVVTECLIEIFGGKDEIKFDICNLGIETLRTYDLGFRIEFFPRFQENVVLTSAYGFKEGRYLNARRHKILYCADGVNPFLCSFFNWSRTNHKKIAIR